MNHYPTEGAAYAAARNATERASLVDAERELRNAVEAWYYAQKRLVNIVECNRNLRDVWEVFQDQARIVERLDRDNQERRETAEYLGGAGFKP